MGTARLLVVEDDVDIANMLKIYFTGLQYDVDVANRGRDALEKTRQVLPHLIVLDIMLPDIDGYEVCRTLRTNTRTSHIPVIFLTQKDERSDKLQGLELGADDYLTKPFNPRELVARVKAILRRSESKKDSDDKPIHRGDLTIDPATREARLASRTLDLRAQEFDLLLTLAESPGRVFSREQLLQLAWGFDYYGQTRTVDVHIAHLRKKLEGGSVKIETVTGVGYKLVTGHW